jgi:ParB family chromosome partitioning protein
MEIKEIPLNKIRPPKISVRKEVTIESVEDLVDSIKKHGIIEPLIVKKAPKGYEIIAGHRRAFAAELAGLDTVPCIIKEGTDINGEIIKLEENLRRKDINPIEEAHFITSLVENYKMSVEDISKISGKSPSYLYERLSILKWPKEILDALEKGLITYSVARELRQIDNETVRRNYLGYAIDGGCSPAMAAAWLRDYKSQKAYYDQQTQETPGANIQPPEIKIVRKCPICREEIEAKDAQIAYCHPECLRKIEE